MTTEQDTGRVKWTLMVGRFLTICAWMFGFLLVASNVVDYDFGHYEPEFIGHLAATIQVVAMQMLFLSVFAGTSTTQIRVKGASASVVAAVLIVAISVYILTPVGPWPAICVMGVCALAAVSGPLQRYSNRFSDTLRSFAVPVAFVLFTLLLWFVAQRFYIEDYF